MHLSSITMKNIYVCQPASPCQLTEGIPEPFLVSLLLYNRIIVLQIRQTKTVPECSQTRVITILYICIVKLWKILTFASPHPPVNKQGTFGDKTGQNGLIIT